MANKKKMGVSPITNKIFYGTVNEQKKMWVGNKTDVTDMAITSVFEWFYNQMKNHEEFSINYPDVEGYELKMVRTETESEGENE